MDHIVWEQKILKYLIFLFSILLALFIYATQINPSNLSALFAWLSGFSLIYSIVKLKLNIDLLSVIGKILLTVYGCLFIVTTIIMLIVLVF